MELHDIFAIGLSIIISGAIVYLLYRINKLSNEVPLKNSEEEE